MQRWGFPQCKQRRELVRVSEVRNNLTLTCRVEKEYLECYCSRGVRHDCSACSGITAITLVRDEQMASWRRGGGIGQRGCSPTCSGNCCYLPSLEMLKLQATRICGLLINNRWENVNNWSTTYPIPAAPQNSAGVNPLCGIFHEFELPLFANLFPPIRFCSLFSTIGHVS